MKDKEELLSRMNLHINTALEDDIEQKTYELGYAKGCKHGYRDAKKLIETEYNPDKPQDKDEWVLNKLGKSILNALEIQESGYSNAPDLVILNRVYLPISIKDALDIRQYLNSLYGDQTK